MKTSTILTALVAIGALLFYLYMKGYIFANFESVDVKEAKKLIDSDRNIAILDVRTPEEYRLDGHLANAMLIPVQQLGEQLDKLERVRDKKLIVYCRSGSRSAMASRILANHGFHPINVRGGINAWKKEGFSLEK
ncbi:rhodanese-like domain-containing protein [Hydrogenimonas sp.]